MSGFHVPKWLDVILTAGDKLHKAVHPSRWGEDKPCKCGERTRYSCSIAAGPNCREFLQSAGSGAPKP